MSNTIIGKFIHTYKDGEIQFQGTILGISEDGEFEVQLFSFIDGSPTDVKFFPSSAIENWEFYDSEKEWVEAYQNINGIKRSYKPNSVFTKTLGH